LRLENLLLDNNGNLKISDFGQARIFSPGWDLFQTQVVGSLYHLSPEQIQGKVYSGEKVDIWNGGIILYSFLTSKLPFCSANVQEMLKDISNVNFEYPVETPLSDEAKELIGMLLQADPEKRPSVSEIKESKWMKMKSEDPKLNIFTIEGISFEKDSFFAKFEKILKMSSVHFSRKENKFDCVHVVTGIKFTLNVEIQNNKIEKFQFLLRKGEVNEFRKFIKKFEKSIK
jgi:serine/threonine protein kinase